MLLRQILALSLALIELVLENLVGITCVVRTLTSKQRLASCGRHTSRLMDLVEFLELVGWWLV